MKRKQGDAFDGTGGTGEQTSSRADYDQRADAAFSQNLPQDTSTGGASCISIEAELSQALAGAVRGAVGNRADAPVDMLKDLQPLNTEKPSNLRAGIRFEACEAPMEDFVKEGVCTSTNNSVCRDLTTLAVDLAAMMARVDNTLMQFEKLRDQLLDLSTHSSDSNVGIAGNSWRLLDSSSQPSASSLSGVPKDTRSCAGHDAAHNATSGKSSAVRAEVMNVIEIARSDAAAIASASVAMERAVNLELVSQLQKLWNNLGSTPYT